MNPRVARAIMWIVRLGSLAAAALGVWLLIALYTHDGRFIIEQERGLVTAAAFAALILAAVGTWIQHVLGWLYPPKSKS